MAILEHNPVTILTGIGNELRGFLTLTLAERDSVEAVVVVLGLSELKQHGSGISTS